MSASKVYMYLNQTHNLYKTHFKTPGTPDSEKVLHTVPKHLSLLFVNLWCPLITFANSLDPYQAQADALMVFLIISRKKCFEKNTQKNSNAKFTSDS